MKFKGGGRQSKKNKENKNRKNREKEDKMKRRCMIIWVNVVEGQYREDIIEIIVMSMMEVGVAVGEVVEEVEIEPYTGLK